MEPPHLRNCCTLLQASPVQRAHEEEEQRRVFFGDRFLVSLLDGEDVPLYLRNLVPEKRNRTAASRLKSPLLDAPVVVEPSGSRPLQKTLRFGAPPRGVSVVRCGEGTSVDGGGASTKPGPYLWLPPPDRPNPVDAEPPVMLLRPTTPASSDDGTAGTAHWQALQHRARSRYVENIQKLARNVLRVRRFVATYLETKDGVNLSSEEIKGISFPEEMTDDLARYGNHFRFWNRMYVPKEEEVYCL